MGYIIEHVHCQQYTNSTWVAYEIRQLDHQKVYLTLYASIIESKMYVNIQTTISLSICLAARQQMCDPFAIMCSMWTPIRKKCILVCLTHRSGAGWKLTSIKISQFCKMNSGKLNYNNVINIHHYNSNGKNI